MEMNFNKGADGEVIRIRELRKSFGNLKVLDGVDLDVYERENFVVLGRSGTGKSVLIKLISGLLTPDSGSVKVFGYEVSQLNKYELMELRLQIGFSFQNSALYDSMSVKENLLFPLEHNARHLTKKQMRHEVESVLDAVGLLSTINQMPSELSGGQRKRIGIARTLIMRPKIMLYDEPTSGLDPITSTEINGLINEVREKYDTTSIIITHDLTCARSTGDRVAMLSNGKFIKKGTFEEVFKEQDERIKQFYEYKFTD
ncbi:MAG: ATP-binding cassette domain-containing protein [Chitinophagaceae bacterium]|nr:ATP-binding cassette domain-containing protein [Chitinophagaceae bacterium]